MVFRNLSLLLCLAISIVGCSSGGDDSSPDDDNNPTVLEGVFEDSAVQGLQYSTATQSGDTDALGEFQYLLDETITFSVGGIVLGQGTAKTTMTPIDIVPGATDENNTTVINICRFLQTLDNDGIPANGIFIPSAIATAAQNETLDFTVSNTEFGTDQQDSQLIATLTGLTSAGERSLVSVEDALLHFREVIGSTPSCTDSDGDGYSTEGGDCGAIDCNDTNSNINPGATEVCGDLVDNDCDDSIDEEIVCGSTPTCTDSDGDGYSTEGGDCGEVDCNDNDIAVNPDATEICEDGIDNDCVDGDLTCQAPVGNYTNNGDGTVSDSSTSLMWQREDDDTKRSWDSSTSYCSISTLANYTDWRLPTLEELESLIDPDYDPDDPVSAANPAIDYTAFPNTNQSAYWSITPNEENDSRAWRVDFSGGVSSSYYKTSNNYARCVRDE